MLPTFLVPGAPKAASTSLHFYLEQHPQIAMGPLGSTGFFTDQWEAGVGWYEQHFTHAGPRQQVGEVAVDYFASPDVPERIAHLLPDVRLIFLLRNPVERAISHYWHRQRQGRETRPPEQVLADPDSFVVTNSRYGTILGRYLAKVPVENVYVMRFEDLGDDPIEALRGLFGFLGVDPVETIDLAPQNVSLEARGRLFAAMRPFARLPYMARPAKWIGGHVRRRRFMVPPTPETAKRRLMEILEPEVSELHRLLGRDMGWTV